MLALVYRPGSPAEKRFELLEMPVQIGRSREQTICIPHESLSRAHARIEPRGEGFELIDLGSKNGSYVNEQRIERQRIRHGDRIRLGHLDLTFVHIEELDRASLLAIRDLSLDRPTSSESASDPRTGERLRKLIEVNKALPLSRDIDALLSRILELLFQLLEVDRGVILLFDEHGELEPRVVRAADEQDSGRERSFFSRNIINYVVREEVAALFLDAANDGRLDDPRSVESHSICSCVCVPLKPRDQLIGVLYIDKRNLRRVYDEDDLEFVLAFASQAATAIDNAGLYQRLERETVTRMQLVMDAKLAAMNSLVAGVAHELRNPLNFISNFALGSAELLDELAQAAVEDRVAQEDMHEALRESLQRIHAHSQRANAVVEAMLAHTTHSTAQRGLVDFARLVENCLGRALERARAEGFEPQVQLELHGVGPTIEAVEVGLDRALFNVIDNSLAALRSRDPARAGLPRLELELSSTSRVARLLVRDNAEGLAPELAARAFEPFFTTKPAGAGIGLGLSLSHAIIVEGHQGSIQLRSVEGQGTCVEIELPRVTLD